MKPSSSELIEQLKNKVKRYVEGFDTNIHPFDIAELLVELRDYDEKIYLDELSNLPQELKALVLIELPKLCHEELLEHFSTNELADLTNNLDTDDAAEFIRNIEEVDGEVAEEVLQNLTQEDRETLETLISYGDYEAGSYMQTELFSAWLVIQ